MKSEMVSRAYNRGQDSGITDEERAANTKIRKLNLDDFTIRANPKDTLVMAGGTKFGDETNNLLKSMLSEMKKSTVLNIDSTNVVQKAIETTYK